MPDVRKVTPSAHMKLHDASVNSYESSGYLSLFKYDLNHPETLHVTPPLETTAGFKYTYNYSSGNNIHVLFIPKTVDEIKLSDEPQINIMLEIINM